MATQDTRDPDEVAGEIARTREELDETLEELGRKLSPDRLKGEARSFVHDKIHSARDKVTGVGRDYPMVALAALGSAVAVATVFRHRRARLAAEERDERLRALVTLVARAAAAGPVLAASNGGSIDEEEVARMVTDSKADRAHAADLLGAIAASHRAPAPAPPRRHPGAMLLATVGLGFALRTLLR